MLRWFNSRSGQTIVAIAVLLGAVSSAPASRNDDPALRSYFSGNGLLNRGLFDLAAVEYQKFLADQPTHEKAPVARYGLAYSLFQLKRHDEAIAELEPLAAIDGFEYAAEADLILGQSRMTLGAFAPATEAFARLERENPQHDLVDDALALHAEALYRQGRFDEVAGPAERLVNGFADSPHRERAELFWGLADMAREDFPAAVGRFDGMVARFPQGVHAAQTSLLLAQSLHRSKDTERALRQYQDVITRATDEYTPDAQYGTALLLHQVQRTQKAGFFLDQLLERYPTDNLVPDAHLLRGRVYFDLGQYPPAAKHFQTLVNANARHADEAVYWLAKCDLREERPDQAARRLAEAQTRFPDSALMPEITYDRGVALIRANQKQNALKVFADLRRRFGEHALAEDALHLMAVTAHQEQAYADSLAHCDTYATEYPNGRFGAFVGFLAGENQFLVRNWQEAVQAYQGFLQQFPNDTQADKARFRLGMAFYQLGDFDRAAPELSRVARGADTQPEFVAALLALGDGNFQREAWGEAEPYLAAYVGFGLMQAGADNALLKLGLCRHRQDRLDDAVQAYDELIGRFNTGPHRQQAIFERGQALVTLGRPDDAIAAFDQLLREEPGSRFEVHALNHLGAIAMQRKEYERAAELYGRVTDASDTADLSGEAIYQRGQSLLAAERFAEAAQAFSRLIREHADSPRRHQAAALEAIAMARDGNSEVAVALIEDVESNAAQLDAATVAAVTYEKAWCLRELDRLQAAGDAYRALLAQGGTGGLFRSATLELAELEFDDDRFDEASELLLRLRGTPPAEDEITPDLAERALYRLAVSQYQLGEHAEAANLLEEFLSTYPSSESVPSASLFCGEAHMKSGNHQQAIAHLELVTTNYRDDDACEPSLLRLGECFATLQSFDRSGQAFAEHRQRYPESALWYQAQFGIGWAHENSGNLGRAMESYKDVIDRHQGPTAARAQFQIGECLFAQNRYDEAARELVKVDILYAYPEWSAAALYEAGRCFQELSNPVDAREQFRKVVKEHSKTKWARMASDRLAELSEKRLPGHTPQASQ